MGGLQHDHYMKKAKLMNITYLDVSFTTCIFTLPQYHIAYIYAYTYKNLIVYNIIM